MPGFPLRQTLTFQTPGNAVSDGVRQLCEFIIRWRLDPAKPQPGFVGTDSSEIVLSPLTAANATFDLNTGEWFRRGLLGMIAS